MRKKFVIALLFICLCIGCNLNSKRSKEHYAKSLEYLKIKDYNNAINEAENSFRFDSTNYDALILKAKIKSKLEFDEEAIKILKTVLSKNYKTDTINFLIGECYSSLGYTYSTKNSDEGKAIEALEEAIKFYNNALAVNPYFYNSYMGKQAALHNQNKYNEALMTINNALKIYPDSIVLICNRGIEKLYLGDRNEALIDLNSSINSKKLDSSNYAQALRFRGNIYAENGNLDLAIQDLTNAINYNSTDELLFATRAAFYRRQAFKDLACKDYRKAAELGMISIYETIKEYCGK